MKLNETKWTFVAPDDGGSGGSGGGQQQQQQQQQTVPDPFKDLDLDLLDDASKAAIEKARGDFKTLHDEAKQKQSYQSEADRLKVELQRLQTEGQQKQQQQQQNGKQTERTFVDDVYDMLVNRGVAPAEAKKAAELQAEITGTAIAKNNEQIQKDLAPTFATIAEQQLTNSFQSAMMQVPAMQEHPELAQAVWEQAQEATKAGVKLSPAALVDLSKIHYYNLTQEGKIKTAIPMVQQQQQQNQQRLTFPGAGSVVARPQTVITGKTAVNADTQAALDAINTQMKNWSPTGKTTTSSVKITRGGN